MELKVTFEHVQKLIKEVILVNLLLYVQGHPLHHVVLALRHVVLVVGPIVLEV